LWKEILLHGQRKLKKSRFVWAVTYFSIFTFSAGTKTYSFLDGDCNDSEAAYLLAISEKVHERFYSILLSVKYNYLYI